MNIKRVEVLSSVSLVLGLMTMPSIATAGVDPGDGGWARIGGSWEFRLDGDLNTPPDVVLSLASEGSCWNAVVVGDETEFTVSIDATEIDGIDDFQDLETCMSSAGYFGGLPSSDEFDPDEYLPLIGAAWIDLEGGAPTNYECIEVEVSDGGNDDFPAEILLLNPFGGEPADVPFELGQATFYDTPGFVAAVALEIPGGPGSLEWDFAFSIRPCGDTPRSNIDLDHYLQRAEAGALPNTR